MALLLDGKATDLTAPPEGAHFLNHATVLVSRSARPSRRTESSARQPPVGGDRTTPHAREKNITEERHTPTLVPLRFLIAFASVVMITLRNVSVEAGVRDSDLQVYRMLGPRAFN
jgi:hypothetical protein